MMNFFKPLAAIIMAASTGLVAQAQEPSITLNSRTTEVPPIITVHSIYDFEQNLSLKIKTDPSLSVSDVLIRAISKMDIRDGRNVRVTSGFDVDPTQNLILGFSGGTAEIIKASRNATGFQVIGSFKNSAGHFVSPPPDKIALYNTSGKKLNFSYQTIQKSTNKMAFALLLDKSGSMGMVLDDVKTTAEHFLSILPKDAECAVASFDTEFEYTTTHYQPCGGGGFGIDGIKVGGGTNIYVPLKTTYQALSNTYFQNHQKAVIIITDGYTMSDPVRKAELLKLKGNVLTFVYFIGGENKNELEALTNHFIAQGGDIKQSLSQYFGSIGQAYNTQKVLTIREDRGR